MISYLHRDAFLTTVSISSILLSRLLYIVVRGQRHRPYPGKWHGNKGWLTPTGSTLCKVFYHENRKSQFRKDKSFVVMTSAHKSDVLCAAIGVVCFLSNQIEETKPSVHVQVISVLLQCFVRSCARTCSLCATIDGLIKKG